MNSLERVTKVKVPGLPAGYEVTHHESRGYDSPDRWYEVSYRGEKVGKSKTIGYGSRHEAAAAAQADDLARTRGAGPRGRAPYQMLERIFGRLPLEGCIIQVEPPEPSGRIPFTVYDPSQQEKDGSPWVHRCGVSPAILEHEP